MLLIELLCLTKGVYVYDYKITILLNNNASRALASDVSNFQYNLVTTFNTLHYLLHKRKLYFVKLSSQFRVMEYVIIIINIKLETKI